MCLQVVLVVYQGNIFNLALYAFIEKDADKAQEWFEALQQENKDFEHLDMLLALLTHLKGDEKESIAQMLDLLSKDRYNRYLNVNLGVATYLQWHLSSCLRVKMLKYTS